MINARWVSILGGLCIAVSATWSCIPPSVLPNLNKAAHVAAQNRTDRTSLQIVGCKTIYWSFCKCKLSRGGRGEVREGGERELFIYSSEEREEGVKWPLHFSLSLPFSLPLLRSPLRFHCTQKILLSTCLSISLPSRSLAPPPCLSSLYKVVQEYRVDLTVIRTFLYCSHILLLFQNHFSQRLMRPTEMPCLLMNAQRCRR